MKTAKDPRHVIRVRAMQDLFTWEFGQKEKPREKLTKEVIAYLAKIDPEIAQAASDWPIEKISRIDLAILRIAIFELLKKQKIPYKVVVDEAVELAKEYGSLNTPSFVNGVLGKIIKKYHLEKEE